MQSEDSEIIDLLFHLFLRVLQHLFNLIGQCHVTLLSEIHVPTIYDTIRYNIVRQMICTEKLRGKLPV